MTKLTLAEDAVPQWREAKVSDLIADGALAVNDGYRVRNVELGEIGTPFVRGGDIGNNGEIITDVADHVLPEFESRLKGKFAEAGDVAFISKGTVGRVGRIRKGQPRIVFAPQVCFWRATNPEVICPTFLYYLLTSVRFQSQLDAVRTHGSMVADYVSLADQRAFTLPFPPILEQRAIAAVLGSLDDKIEQNRRTGRKLEELARAVFKEWFVDFGPVNAKAAGATAFPGMPPETFATLPTTLTDSPLGPVPEGWKVNPLSEVCKLVSGGTPKRSESTYWGGDIPWYSVKDAPADGGPWVYFTNEHITQKGLDESAANLVPTGCTIISARGTVGKLAMAGREMTFNQSCYGLLPSDGRSFRYLNLLMNDAVVTLQQRTHGSVFATITRQTFEGIQVVVPPPELVESFDCAVTPIFDLQLAQLKESVKLAALRDYFLPRLLSGRVRVGVSNG